MFFDSQEEMLIKEGRHQFKLFVDSKDWHYIYYCSTYLTAFRPWSSQPIIQELLKVPSEVFWFENIFTRFQKGLDDHGRCVWTFAPVGLSVMVAKNFSPCPDTTQLVHLYNRPHFMTFSEIYRRICGLFL